MKSRFAPAFAAFAIGAFSLLPSPVAVATAQDAPLVPAPRPPAEASEAAPTTLADLIAVVRQIDEDAEIRDNGATFAVAGREVQLVADVAADRMRLISAIAPLADLPDDTAERVLAANFSTALDARYAVSDGILWSAFIHPLGSLTEEDYLSGIAQTVNAAENFGTSFSSGAMQFGTDGGETEGGDMQPDDLRDDIPAVTTDI